MIVLKVNGKSFSQIITLHYWKRDSATLFCCSWCWFYFSSIFHLIPHLFAYIFPHLSERLKIPSWENSVADSGALLHVSLLAHIPRLTFYSSSIRTDGSTNEPDQSWKAGAEAVPNQFYLEVWKCTLSCRKVFFLFASHLPRNARHSFCSVLGAGDLSF